MKEEKKSNYDLFFMLMYMTSIATADVRRSQIIKYASEQKDYIISGSFRQIHILASRWSYEYAEACKLISNNVKGEGFSQFLGRMATSLETGEPERDFLQNDMKARREMYRNEYERNIEELKKWTEGYTALIVSVTLVITIIMISSMIYPMPNFKQTAIMVLFLEASVCAGGVLALYDSAPVEKKIHTLKSKSREQRKLKSLAEVLIPLGVISVAILISQKVKLGYAFMAASFFMFPVGILAIINDMRVDKRDSGFPTFIKTVGVLAGTTGVTTSNAMSKLDTDAIGFLKPLVDKLYLALSLKLNPGLCWGKFIEESGSETINRFSRMFNDAVDLGGDPVEVGDIVSSSSLEVVLLRMKRKMVSSGFAILTIVLHFIMCGLLVVIMEIVKTFKDMMDKMYAANYSDLKGGMEASSVIGQFHLFGMGSDIAFLYQFTIAAVLILTISNMIAIKITEGGENYKILFYGAIMSLLSGIALIGVPIVVAKFFVFEV